MEIGIKQGKVIPGRVDSVEEDPWWKYFATSNALREGHWGQMRLGAGWQSDLMGPQRPL